MTDQRRKRPRDTNQLAKFIVDVATGEAEDGQVDGGKDPVAVAAGQKGGKIGGIRRAEKLSPLDRKRIAANAARARWLARGSEDNDGGSESD